MRAEPRLCILYPGICLTTEENHGKPQSVYPKGDWLISSKRESFSRRGHRGRWHRLAGTCRPFLSSQATGSTLGQLKYLPICRTRGFHTSANFESKLAVRALMCSANNGTLRSSCICLLLSYQGAALERRRHLDCNNCNLQSYVRAADLQVGHV